MRLLIVLFIAVTSFLVVAGIKEHFQDDVDRLRNGENLLYMSVGDRLFNSKLVLQTMHAHHASAVKCLNICGSRRLLEEIRGAVQAGTSNEKTLVVVSGLNHLDRTELRSLDFAYRLTDSSSDIAGAIILLLLESNTARGDSQEGISKAEYDELKLQLAETLNEDSVYFNGHAFTGRLSHIFFQQSVGNISLAGTGCASAPALPDDVCSIPNTTSTSLLPAGTQAAIPRIFDKISIPEAVTALHSTALGVAVAVAALIVLVSILVRCCTHRDNNNVPQTMVQQPQTVSAQIIGAGPRTTCEMSYGIAPERESVPSRSWDYASEPTKSIFEAPHTPAAPRTQQRSERRSAEKSSGERRARPASDSHKHSKATGAAQDGAGNSGGGRKRHSTGTSVGHEYATRSKDHH